MKKIYIRKSRIAGRGIYAGENIRKGEFVTFMTGKLIHKNYRTKSDLKVGHTWVPVALHRWIQPVFPIKFINHSCEPNVGFKTPRRVYAMKNIAKGEEITIDYSTVEYVPFWSIPCTCGAPHCRKTVRSIQFLPPATYKAYLPYIPKFLRRAYSQGKVRV